MKSIKAITDKSLLVIMDGFGINPNSPKNAVIGAETPTLDQLFKNYPYTEIESSGLFVGLPKGLMGNSEVGHMNIGAGKPVRQDLVRIDEAISTNTLEGMDKLKELILKSKNSTKRIHLMGLLSDGGVHSHINHIKSLIEILTKHEDLNIYFHAFMDGRDTSQDCGHTYVKELQKIQNYTFASMSGRAKAMDRDKRFEKIETVYNMLIGNGNIKQINPYEYIQSQYQQKIYDEFVEPVLFNEDGKIQNGDSIFFINFRPDRAIELTQTFNLKDFKHFKRPVLPGHYLCMTPYIQDELDLPILFDKEALSGTLTEYLSNLGKKQFKIAETEKYAHVTYFFNGGKKEPFPLEERVLIESPRDVPTYDKKPEMSAIEVCDRLIEEIKKDETSFYTVNFANPDMVGHTGKYDAAIKAIETVDRCVEKIIRICEEKKIAVLITADHGNSDQMTYEDGSPHTAHTAAKVPFCIVHPELKNCSVETNEDAKHQALNHISPTILYLMDIKPNPSFSGKNIFK